jgi:hypothetical protein
MWPTPAWCGYSPVSSAAREGQAARSVIELGEPHAPAGEVVKVGRGYLPAVTAHVGKAEIVGQNNDNVRFLRLLRGDRRIACLQPHDDRGKQDNHPRGANTSHNQSFQRHQLRKGP